MKKKVILFTVAIIVVLGVIFNENILYLRNGITSPVTEIEQIHWSDGETSRIVFTRSYQNEPMLLHVKRNRLGFWSVVDSSVHNDEKDVSLAWFRPKVEDGQTALEAVQAFYLFSTTEAEKPNWENIPSGIDFRVIDLQEEGALLILATEKAELLNEFRNEES